MIGRTMPQGDIPGFAPPLRLTADQAGIVDPATVKVVKAVLG